MICKSGHPRRERGSALPTALELSDILQRISLFHRFAEGHGQLLSAALVAARGALHYINDRVARRVAQELVRPLVTRLPACAQVDDKIEIA